VIVDILEIETNEKRYGYQEGRKKSNESLHRGDIIGQEDNSSII
jgi:hypothetical protein